jgi:hypothetical protein
VIRLQVPSPDPRLVMCASTASGVCSDAFVPPHYSRRRIKVNRLAALVSLIALLGIADLARADIFMRQNQHVDAFQMMGQSQPASDMEVSIWMTDKGMRSDNPKQSAIVKPDEKVLILLNHEQRTIARMPLDPDAIAANLAAGGEDMPPGDKVQLQELMEKMTQIKVSITDTGEQTKVGDWNCTKYLQTIETFMGPSTTEVWATEDLDIDMDRYVDLTTAMMAMQPGMKENLAQVQREVEKIKGVRGLEKTSPDMMGAKVNSTIKLLEFQEGKAPADLFDLPQGYANE